MNDIVKDLGLIPIDSVSLSQSEVGENINERFSNIDKNFQTIINSEYLKGQTGDGIYAKECLFEKDSEVGLGIYKSDQTHELTSGELYELISECILTDVEYQNQPTGGRIPKGKIVLIYQNVDDRNILISSLPYVFIDEAYLNGLRAEDKPNPNEDLSCIVYFENDNFVKSSTIPKIYYDDKSATFCWNINGVDTQLPAQGPKGDDGKQGLSIYYAKCEYINKQYKLTRIFDPEQGKYVVGMTLDKGNLILAYVIKSDSSTVAINDVVLGTYNNGFIENNIKLNIPDISELMKNNPDNALYVNVGSQDENIFHSIYSAIIGEDKIPSLKMGMVGNDNTQIDSQLMSCYPNNIFEHNVEIGGKLKLSESNKPSIQNNQNNIRITVGDQTSDEFTVPFATNATNAEFIGSDSNNVGNYNQPVYIYEGKPTAITIDEGTSDSENCLLTEARNAPNQIWSTTGITANYSKKTLTAEGGFIGNLQGTATNATNAINATNAEYSRYSGYSINPIVISAQNDKVQLQSNKINYVWIANGVSTEGIQLKLSLPVLNEESYVSMPNSLNRVGICQCVLLVDANITFEMDWKHEVPDECVVQYSMDSTLLEAFGSGIKEIIFTGYWNKSDGQMNVVWIVGGDTHQVVTV